MPSAAIFAAASSSLRPLMSIQWSTDFLIRVLRRIRSVDAAIIGENLEVLAVVLFHDVGHGEADGMLAQVGRDIADAQSLRIGRGRRPPMPDATAFGMPIDCLA